jgi:predicted permease
MGWPRSRTFDKLRLRLRSVVFRKRLDDELDIELAFHLEQQIQENLAAGMGLEEARFAARRAMGGVAQIKEKCRETRGVGWIADFMSDIRYARRTVARAPVFATTIILTLALGIGANTAVFSVVRAVLLRPPSYPNGERLTEIWEATSGQRIPVSWNNFQHWRRENHTFEEMAGIETADLTLTGRGDAVLTRAGVVSSSFFRLTGWQPLAGRLFNEADDKPGAAPVVLISSEFRARVLNNVPRVVGSTLTLDGTGYEIVGILPPAVRFFAQPVDFYVPAGPRDGKTVNRAEHGAMVVMALLKPGLTLLTGTTDLDAIMRRFAVSDPGRESDHRSSISWLADFGRGDVRLTLLGLMAAVGLVLIIACANVAILLLVRSTTRMREIATRSAIGATRSRLAAQLLTENFLIVAPGGAVGLLLAGICLRFLLLMGPQDIPRLWDVRLNLPVLSFTVALTVLTGLLAGTAPIIDIRGLDISRALQEGSPVAGRGRRGQTVRSSLMITEIALSLILTFGCALLLRSLIVAQGFYPGFSADRVLALELQLPPSRFKTDEAVRQFYGRLLQHLRSEPGVESVGVVNCPPSTGGCAKGWYSIADMPPPAPADVPLTLLTKVDPDYFRTIRMSLRAGRAFNDADRDNGRAVIVNEKLARRWWPDRPQLAIGHRIKLGGPYMPGRSCEIVGVVGDVSQSALDVESFPEIYVKGASTGMVVMIRSRRGDPAALVPAARRELESLDRNVPVVSLMPFSSRMAATLDRRRFSTMLLEIFAGLAVALSAVGIYGILNYWMGMRQKEIAVRMALGAGRSHILRWTGTHIVLMATLGISIGAVGCWGTSRLLRSMLFGVSAKNPWMFVAASGVVVAMVALAAGVPVWRATRVDPIRHLHDA